MPSPIRVASKVAAVDRAVRADLDVVVDLEPAGMRDLDVPAVDQAVAEAVAAEHGAGVDLDAVAQDHVAIEHGIGMDDDVAAQPAAVADDGAGVERRLHRRSPRSSPT